MQQLTNQNQVFKSHLVHNYNFLHLNPLIQCQPFLFLYFVLQISYKFQKTDVMRVMWVPCIGTVQEWRLQRLAVWEYAHTHVHKHTQSVCHTGTKKGLCDWTDNGNRGLNDSRMNHQGFSCFRFLWKTKGSFGDRIGTSCLILYTNEYSILSLA